MSKILMHKKAQFYIFIAVAIIAVALSIFIITKPAERKSDLFKNLHDNYLTEAEPAVAEDASFARFDNFTDEFLAFAKETDNDFRLLYIYKNKDQIRLRNLLKQDVQIQTPSASFALNSGASAVIGTANFINVNLAGNNYNFTIENEDYVLHTLFRTSGGSDVRIYYK